MNFLAHLFLSGKNEDLLIGNFITDFIRGKEQKEYSSSIRKGIELHRVIDQYTDSHQVVKLSVEKLLPKYKRYAPVVIDIFYDHFLAKNWQIYSNEPLDEYADWVYTLLSERKKDLPKVVADVLPRMIKENWLENYATDFGINHALRNIAHRARFDSKVDEAHYELKQYYSEFDNEFLLFFPELESISRKWIANLQLGN